MLAVDDDSLLIGGMYDVDRLVGGEREPRIKPLRRASQNGEGEDIVVSR
jgi:hypothetical protein